uniref:ENTH domain-containing protein n=1 Tax=Apostasia odorata TaxID=280455 RepID=A0A1S6YFW4_9ASPA|nr:hypothetical protein [Apostasia odorata]
MAQSKIRKALGAMKDKTSIGLAKVVSGSTTVVELEVAVVKATKHDEYPAEEKHVREILSLTSYSRANVAVCVALLSRRLGKTRSWAVALKTLILVHRLLADGDPAFEQEVFFATRRGTRMLNMADFRDGCSKSGNWDFSSFVRTYARYLDERLEYKMHGRRRREGGGAAVVAGRRAAGDEETDDGEEGAATPARSTPVRDMVTDRLFAKAHHLQELLDRFLAGRPTGTAKTNRIVAMALYPMVKESFQIYSDLTEIVAAFVDRFMDLPVRQCLRVFDLFSRLSKQFEDLDTLYTWSRTAGIARASDYPEIDHITPNKLAVMDEFIRDRSAIAEAGAPAKEELPASAAAVDVNEVHALPPLPQADEEEKKETGVEEGSEEAADGKELVVAEAQVKEEEEEEVVNFLNLRSDEQSTEQNSDSLALALFSGEAEGPSAAAQPWEAFKETADWEKALVESASNLAGQKPNMAGGLDMLLLDGMYSHGAVAAAAAGTGGSAGSASSLALAAPAMLALPAPPGAGAVTSSSDPFAASAEIPPPAWVQMSEMEKKQHLLVEEQRMWQQYARDGMQGKFPAAGGGGVGYPMIGYRQRL